MDLLEKFAQLTQAAAGRLTVRSALNPFLWLCAIVSPVCFLFAYFFRTDRTIALVLVAAGVFPVLFTCLVDAFFAVFKAERLQSEDYQLRSESLKILREKGGRLTLDPASLESIANPPLPPTAPPPEPPAAPSPHGRSRRPGSETS